MITRRDFFTWCGGVVITSGPFASYVLAQSGAVTPIVPGPEVEQFKIAQQKPADVGTGDGNHAKRWL